MILIVKDKYKRDQFGRFLKGTEQPNGFGKGKQKVPWNKDKKTGLIPKTAFKKGQKPWNDGLNKETNPSLRKLSDDRMGKNNPRYKRGYHIWDGYKILSNNGNPIEEHRFIWEQTYGKIPQGMIIHHKNGDRMDNRIENLECLTNSEHIKIHKMWSKK